MADNIDDPSEATRADFALMQAQPGAMERYWRLAVETWEYFRQLEANSIFKNPGWIDFDDAARLPPLYRERIPPEHLDVALFARWEDWADEFDTIYQASPKWRMKEMISEISETHQFIGWPQRWEREIWQWAITEGPEPECPFDDRKDVIDPQFRALLRSLIEEVDGFLYRSEDIGLIVFAPTEDLERIWRQQDHVAKIDRNKLFGYWFDVSRPNFKMRAPTEEEEWLLEAIFHPAAAPQGWLARLLQRFKLHRPG